MSEDVILKIDHVGKEYMLGTISSDTLKDAIKEKLKRRSGKKTNETFRALNDVSFEVRKGEAIGLIGSNGAGKSTLLKLISRITAPTEGNIYINGRIASMLEVGTGFHQELTGRENIYLNGSILGMSKKEIDSKIDDIIAFSECEKFIDTPVKRYSSGMYVKLAFAVASHLDAEIMIMDEVLAVGDEQFQAKCLNKMKQVAEEEKRTILYVSHNMNTIYRLCNRCLVMNHGQLIYDGDVEGAVRLYRGDNLRTDTSVDLQQYIRPGWLGRDDIRLTYAEYPDKEDCIFNGDTIRLALNWKYRKDAAHMGIRVELSAENLKPFASAVVYDIDSGTAGDTRTAIVEIPIANVRNGKYATFYTIFCVDQYGNSVDFDCVIGLDIEIRRPEKEMNWVSQSWGHVELDAIRVIDKQTE